MTSSMYLRLAKLGCKDIADFYGKYYAKGKSIRECADLLCCAPRTMGFEFRRQALTIRKQQQPKKKITNTEDAYSMTLKELSEKYAMSPSTAFARRLEIFNARRDRTRRRPARDGGGS